MRIVRKLAYLSPLLLLVGCTGYDTTRPTYGGGTHSGGQVYSGGQVISSPRTSSSPVYPGTPSNTWGSADATLSSDIRRAIGLDQALKTTASQVLVSAQAGVVTLRGSVPDQQAHDSLISVVRNTPGVVRIVDETHITATGVSSPQYQTQTQSAPVFSSGGGSLAETGPTSDGGSAVGGQIFSMQVDTLTETDRTLAQRILQGLRTDSGVSDLLPRVNINVSEGRILLQGHVQNEEQKRTIEEAVRRAAGISNIENRLQVRQ